LIDKTYCKQLQAFYHEGMSASGASKTTMTQAVARYEAAPREGSLLTAVG
jgi:hypothetical protein